MDRSTGFADSTTDDVPREPSDDQIIDLTIEHEEEVIELSDPLWEEGFNGDEAEVLPLYENCLGCNECEPGCSTSQQNGWDRTSGASEHSANADDDEADWSRSQINAWDQASWSSYNGLPASGQQTPNSIRPSVDENNEWDQASWSSYIGSPASGQQTPNSIRPSVDENNSWDQASWSSYNGLPASGQQTPNSIQPSDDENNDESLEQVENPQLFHEFENRILARIEELSNQLHSRLDTFDHQLRQIYGQHDSHGAGLDRQHATIEEIAHDLRHQIQAAENSFRRLHDLTFEQMRERQLMFEAVCAMFFPIFYP
nr:uncharacterized protein LOC129434989 [Misgurnus anguillicaudatus]